MGLKTELVDPTADRFAADLNTAPGQQRFDVADAQREPKIQSSRMTDHVRREAVSLERYRRHDPPWIDPRVQSGDLLALACQHRQPGLAMALRAAICT